MARLRLTLKQASELNARTASMTELRAAYTALRDVMEKRTSRLMEGTETQQRWARPFREEGGERQLKTLAQLDKLQYVNTPEQRQRDLAFRVQELQQFVESPRLSLQGWKEIDKRTLQSLRSSGYGNIGKGNLKQFGDYMEQLRSMYGDKFFPSAEAAEAYNRQLDGVDRMLDPGELTDLVMDFAGGQYGDGVDLFAW